MNRNKFDIVMDYIDANIHCSDTEIKRKIYDLTGYNSHTFGEYFKLLTDNSLGHYITLRRLYFAGETLRCEKTRSICDIAISYGYSDQSSFSRAMKAYFDCTPNEIRKKHSSLPNNRFRFKDFAWKASEGWINKILSALDNNDPLHSSNMQYLYDIEQAANDYGLDIDTCYQIADLAEKLEIPTLYFIKECFRISLEIQNHPQYVSPKEEIMALYSIESEDELNDICSYFGCEYYDLDTVMVQIFHAAKEFPHG